MRFEILPLITLLDLELVSLDCREELLENRASKAIVLARSPNLFTRNFNLTQQNFDLTQNFGNYLLRIAVKKSTLQMGFLQW